jgi:uncharacterized membrane protein
VPRCRARHGMQRPTPSLVDPSRHSPSRRGWPRGRFLHSVEVRILALGVGLCLATVIALGVAWLVAPDVTSLFAAMTGLNLTVGRAAGMSFGFASGLGHPAVISSNVLTETIQVLVVYPLFVLGWNSLVDVRYMRRLLVTMRQSAEANQARVERYGMLGLFAFVFLPFWMTGPVVGAIIGHLIGLKARHTLPTVLVATYFAVAIWAVFFERMNELMAEYGRYAAFGTVLVVGAVVIAVRSVRSWRQGHHHDVAARPPGPVRPREAGN